MFDKAHWFIKQILIFLVRAVAGFFRTLAPRSCRFHPTCSVYAVEAIEALPLHTALYKIFKRILRCQPFCEGGLDPVHSPLLKEERSVYGA